MNVCIVGLGYVGGPLLCQCAKKGFATFGYDINQGIIQKYSNGISPIDDEFIINNLPLIKDKVVFSTNPKNTISKADFVIICVPTPVTKDKQPDFGPLKRAMEVIAENYKKGVIIISESTVNPGATEDLLLPIMAKTGKIGVDFCLGHCPERIDPANVKNFNITNIPRVLGMINRYGIDKAMSFYRQIIDANILLVDDVKSAEASKILENTFRDVNIAFVNQMALCFEKMGINALEVIEAASTKPFAFIPHWPGCGVGGHCIPVDPYYMIKKAEEIGCNLDILKIARQINESMPGIFISKLYEGCDQANIVPSDSVLSVLGLAYKPNIGDTRESVTYKVLPTLKKNFRKVIIFDPHVQHESTVNNLNDATKADVVMLFTGHPEFRNIRISHLISNKVKLVVDGRNFWDPLPIKHAGIIYKGIGRK